ncbi:MAG: hypothetical protein KBD51_00015 [Candidatus Levybacteria bacterium]|nr:hypothetical protein [Candidatus Levybacteria bacterium]
MNYSNFLKLIRTKDEQNEVINLIEELTQGLYKKQNKTDPPSPYKAFLSNEIMKIIQAQKIIDNKIKTEKFCNSLLEAVKNLTVLKLTIAIEPDQKMITSIKNWVDKNSIDGGIFEFTIDPNILGGAVIVNHKGSYADFSLLKRIDELFLNQKQLISKLL